MSEATRFNIGQYEILDEIGHGGMATVYRAYQPRIEREVAIKLLPHQFTSDPTFLARFQREVEVAARLQHPRILPVYDFGEHEGQPYLVMAYLPTSLAERIAAHPNGLPLKEAIRILTQLAEGLDYLHAQGIVHRDFKPSNVLLDAAGDCYLADFGVALVQEATAHLTGTGLLGTPQYMAPEMFVKGETMPQTDIYALGVTLFEMLTGQRPFDSDLPAALMRAQLEDRVPDIRNLRPDLPPGIQLVIEGAMAKAPERRYQSAGEMAAALRTVMHPGTARQQVAWLLPAMGIVAVMLILGGGGYLLTRAPDLTPIPTAQESAVLPTASAVYTTQPTAIPTDTPSPTFGPSPTPIPIIGGGTGILGFNANGLGYTVDVSCVLAGGQGCDPIPHILPDANGMTPFFGEWSPDGSRIAFLLGGNPILGYPVNALQGYVYDVAAKRIIRINASGNSYNLIWAADGQRMAYVTEGNIWVTDLTCEEEISAEPCTANGSMIFDLPGSHAQFGDLLAGWLPDNRIIIKNPTSVRASTLLSGYYSMAPDGANVQYYAEHLGTPFADIGYFFTRIRGDFYVAEAATQRSWLVAPGLNTLGSISPDGHYLVLNKQTSAADDYELFLLDLMCVQESPFVCIERLIQITDNDLDDGLPSWSPDSRWLIFGRAQEIVMTPSTVDERGVQHFRRERHGVDLYLIDIAATLANGADSGVVKLTSLGIVDWGDDYLGSTPQWQPAPRE